MKVTSSLKSFVSLAIALSAAVSAAPINNFTFSNSTISNSTISDSTINNSTTSNSTISTPTINDSTISNSTTSNSTISARAPSNCQTLSQSTPPNCGPRLSEKFSVIPGFAANFDAAVPQSSWLHADCIWENHKYLTGTPDLAVVSKLKKPVYRAACETNIDPALIMSIIFQESHGMLNIPRTIAPDGSSSNGIMQSDGCPSMDGRDPATISEDDVYAMVRCGAQHFKGNMNDPAKNPKNDPWVALRLYNSGSVAPSGDLNDGNGATAHYVIEVANRLRGWAN